MIKRRITLTRTTLLLAALLPALLSGCGGKGGAPAADDGRVAISGRAVDGPLAGATTCYDLDDDHACGAGEPRSAPTTADGAFTLSVPAARAGRHAVVVEVPASAVDADTGTPVGQAFVLRAPPALVAGGPHEVFVSPLTTLVHALMVQGGAARSVAEAQVRESAALAISPLADFTRERSAAGEHAARVARLVQLTANEQMRTLAALAGTPDRNGTPITTAMIEREVLGTLAAILPVVAQVAQEPQLVAAAGDNTTLQPLLAERALALAQNAGPTPDVVRAAATLQRLAEPPPANPPQATASLGALRYANRDDWYLRTLPSSAADNVPDGSNNVRYYDLRMAAAPPNAASAALPGVMRSWSWGNTISSAGDLHWNGSAWVACLPTDRFPARVRDSQGRSDFQFCNNRESGITQRRVEDIAGQRIDAVVRDKIRTMPGGNSGVAFADFGPDDLSLYGDATFPTGSYLVYQSNTLLTSTVSYNVQTSNQVLLFSAAVAAGGDLRQSPTLACGNATLNTVTTPATTLEEMVNRVRGTPCLFPAGGQPPNQSTDPDEVWGFASLTLGDLAGQATRPPNTGTFYSTNLRLRVAFSGSNRAVFYRCLARASNNAPRNCTVMGLGTWSIQDLADGRILTFSTMPALAQRLGFARSFVERGGRVYFGFRNPVGRTTLDVRLNLPAANALLRQLGLPPIQPVTQPGTATGQRATNLATLQGAWGSSSATDATVFRFGPIGRFWLGEAKLGNSVTREQSGTELGWFDHDPATGQVSTLLEVDSSLTSGTSHPRPGDPPITITPTTISNGAGFSLGRLPNDATGLVGMWALGTAGDLSVPHLVFFANGRVLLADHGGGTTAQCTPTGEGPPGAEYASWTYDADEQVLTIQGKIHDTNGCAGLFDSSAASIAAGTDNLPVFISVTFASDFLSVQFAGSRGTQTWFRIPVQ
jgi:trimeric autotransporter adhesin